MKKKITILLLAAVSAFSARAQQVFSESFTAPFNPAAAGWNIQNLSAPVGSTSWFQGSNFPALTGGLTDYYAANFNSTGPNGANNTISTWLITPTLNLQNGAMLQFATRCSGVPFGFAERLQVYYSTAGAGTNVGAGPGTATNTAGTFTNIILDINPTLAFNGYPTTWSFYNVTLSGIAAPTVGRLAFRYYVTSGGAAGLNSNYIGIDEVSYSLPCAFPNFQLSQSSMSVCAGSTSSLSVVSTGSVPTLNSYTWSAGTTTAQPVPTPSANVSPVVVSPTLNTLYILTGESTPGCYFKRLIPVMQGLPPNIQVPSYTVCANPQSTATLIASGGVNYQWSNGANTNSTVVTPNTTTVYTVTGTVANNSCPGTAQSTVTISNNLSVGLSASSTSLCSSNAAWGVTITATAAGNNYLWSNGATSSAITVSPGVTTTYTVGVLSGACVGSNSITINVPTSPTITAVVSPSPVCAGVVHTISASGAANYIIDLNNPAPTAIAATSATFIPQVTNMFLFVSGTAANGCFAATALQPTVQPTPTVAVLASNTLVCAGTVITLTASGASTYSWSGAASSTASPLTYTTGSTGSQQFSVTGTSAAGCKNSAVATVMVNTCTGLDEKKAVESRAMAFPNPFSHELRISEVYGAVIIYNALGQQITGIKVKGSAAVPTSQLPAGVYIARVYDAEGNWEKDIKLVKE